MQLSLVRRLDETGIPLLAARLVLGVTFLVMGWEKGWDPVAFLKLLREYEMIPDGFYVIQNIISVVLPWIEVVCGVALILGVCIRGSALSLLLLLTFFTVLIIYRATMIHLSPRHTFLGNPFRLRLRWRRCSYVPENPGESRPLDTLVDRLAIAQPEILSCLPSVRAIHSAM